jgi:hypothetical protein
VPLLVLQPPPWLLLLLLRVWRLPAVKLFNVCWHLLPASIDALAGSGC